MDRLIKFRCWHNEGNVKLEGGRIVSISPAMIYDTDPGDCLVWKRQGQNIEDIMQFTGLYDATTWEELNDEERTAFWNANKSDDGKTIKFHTPEHVKHLWKGREIYEGDIVSEDKSIGVVVYRQAAFRIDWKPNKDFFSEWLEHHAARLKVIGTIHDNFDLLNAAK